MNRCREIVRMGRVGKYLTVSIIFSHIWSASAFSQGERGRPSQFVAPDGEIGRLGGTLVVALSSEIKTLNPILSVDVSSREVMGVMHADLVHINRESQRTEAALAESWSVSASGLRYTVRLRQGLRFSDGAPMDADDVVFSYRAYLDPNVHSPQRDLLLIDGKPISVEKIDSRTVLFEFAKAYAPAERVFDGLAILPRHLLEKAYQEGKLGQVWNLASATNEVAGLGPFRFKEYVPGQKLVCERNPYYWKADRDGHPLPYLENLVFVFVPNEDAQVLRLISSETQILERLGAANFVALRKRSEANSLCLKDLGPSLEYTFLFFNLNDLSGPQTTAIIRKQEWFRDENFRKAISAVVDRDGISRLVYGGHALPIWSQVTPGNKFWVDSEVPRPAKSADRARELLTKSGFRWKSDGTLEDGHGTAVEFTIMVSSSRTERIKIATIVQDDLAQLGIRASVLSVEARSLTDRLFNSKEYEAMITTLASGDADPGSEMNVWTSGGATHLWDLGQKQPHTEWEAAIDKLMEQQLGTLNPVERKQLYDRVQRLVADHVPMIFLVSPNILVGSARTVGNFRPGILYPYGIWNADQLFFRADGGRACQ